MKACRTPCRRQVMWMVPLLIATTFPQLHAGSDDGWFEVSRSAAQASVAASSAAVPAHTRLLENGWQAVPGIRHERQQLPSSVSTSDSSRQTPLVKPDHSSSSQTLLSVNDDSGSEPLILSRGEIQEIERRQQAPARGAGEQPEVARQRQRNRLPASAVSTVNIDMFAGEVKVLGKVDVTRVAIGNGDIVRAEVLDTGELLVIGEVEGSTSLRLWHSDKTQSDYNIRVSGADPETRVRMETMVRMRVRMIEFRKSALGKLGIDWSDSAAGPGFAVAGDAVGNNLFRLPSDGLAANLPNTVKPFSTYFGVASSITSRINFLASTGDATTLAEPVLSTTNGGSASFLAGGEVPYPSEGANGQTVVQFKEYGIKLNVTPRIDASGNVRTLVETEISQLDPAVSIQGTPGLLTRRAQTQVNVRSGETIVISGLLSSESSKDVDKLPGIGNLPVIGSFFRSKNARNSVSELVIFVTPEIIEPEGRLLSEREGQFLSRSEQQFSQAQSQIRLLD